MKHISKISNLKALYVLLLDRYFTLLCVLVVISQLVNVHLKLDGTVSRLDPQAKPHNNLYYIATGIKITMHALYVHMYYI